MTSRVAIFGATSAIATEVARLMAKRGASLVLVGRSDERLQSLAADLRVRGASDVAFVATNLAAMDTYSDLVDRTWTKYGGLDAVLIAYGSLPDQTHVQDDPVAVADALWLNFVSVAALCAALALRFAEKRGGMIAVITSVAGDRGRGSNYVYGAAKGGLQRYLEGLRHRMRSCGVAVLDVRPGIVATPMTAHLGEDGLLWATPRVVAHDIVDAMVGQGGTLYTPWFWRPIMLAIRALPAAIFHRTRL
jgi:short-subunit dehydrogenase